MERLKDMRDAYAFEHRNMTYEESDIFAKCVFLDSMEKGPFNIQDASMLGTAGEVIWKRKTIFLASRDFPISKGLAGVACGFSKFAGEAILWLFTFHRMHKEVSRMLRLEDFSDVFPWGIPTDEAIQELWRAQKARTDDGRIYNRVDDIREWDAA